MRFIVDEMPDYEKECPFYRSMLWISDCVKKRHACFITKKSCDRTDDGCHILKPIRAEETLKAQADAMRIWVERYAEQRTGILTAVNIVEDIKPADVVPVVRCKDCREFAKTSHWCESFDNPTGEDDFCSCGERKE